MEVKFVSGHMLRIKEYLFYTIPKSKKTVCLSLRVIIQVSLSYGKETDVGPEGVSWQVPPFRQG